MKAIRTALERLQQDSDDGKAWQALESAVEKNAAEHLEEIHELFTLARAAHAERHEWWAQARLLALEIAATPQDAASLLALLREYGSVQLQRLYDDGEAENVWGVLLSANPDDSEITDQLSDIADKRAQWQSRAEQYLSEAEGTQDDVYKSSMLMRVAEMELRYGGDSMDPDQVERRLHEACLLDPDNQGACEMYEYMCRRSEHFSALAEVLDTITAKASSAVTRVVYAGKLARIHAYRLKDNDRAAAAFQKLLEDQPADAEATRFLSEYHAERGAWQELVRVYERRLAAEGDDSADRLGDTLQIALLYYRKLGQPEQAEPWFEKVRKLDPSNAAMIEFFREYLAQTGDSVRLQAVLQTAEKAMPEGSEKAAVSDALVEIHDSERGAQLSIDELKAQLRQDPNNGEIRAKLKELYREAGSHNALIELLRQQLERTPNEETEQRLLVLREVADLYREHLPGDPALVSVLTQISTLDVQDAGVLRELCAAYERLARWRDLLSCQQRLADITPDASEKVELLRAIARRWLDQFTNVQNATAAYEALLAAEPKDAEARAKLQELYTKRRAWQSLYELLSSQVSEDLSNEERVALLTQMAQLCAERMSRAQEAMELYKQVVEIDPGQTDVIEALERQAERAKDWATLAYALERRVDATDSTEGRAALLQKLGSVYGDHLQDSGHAIAAWRRVVELQPGHTRALRFLRDAYVASGQFDALEELYVAQNDFEGLAEVLGSAAEKTEDPQLRIDLSYRAARVYSEMLGQPVRAFRSYERVLATDPADVRAAEALIPIYEEDEKWARLPALYELLIGRSDSPGEQLDLLRKVINITGVRLGDRQGSLAYGRRAFELAPEDPGALELFEKAAAAAGKWDVFAEALSERLTQLQAQRPAASTEPVDSNKGNNKKKRRKGRTPSPPPVASEGVAPFDPAARDLVLRLAQICDAYLQQADRAAQLLKEQLRLNPADEDVALRLETILRREGKREDLRWVLELKVEQAQSDEARIHTLTDWARLEGDTFRDFEQASELYRRLLELQPGNIEALRARVHLLLEAGGHATAATTLEASLDHLDGLERAEMEVLLAQMYLEHLGQPDKALEHAVGTLKYGSHDTRAIAVLERLVQVDATRERAAQVLATEYAEVGDARHEVEALQAMFGASKDAEERLTLLLRLVSIQEQKLDSVNAAFETLLRAVREFPERMDLWDQAEELAARADRAGELSEAYRETLAHLQGGDLELDICERAARLHQDRLGDPGGAVPYLERILKRDPANSGAFAQLKHVLTAEERWAELAGLYDLVIAEESSPALQVELLLEVALLCEEITEDLNSAVVYYERILEIDPVHESALRALDRLYLRLGKDELLCALLERRIPEASDNEQAELQNRLAALLIDKLHRPADAVGHLEAALQRDVSDVTARDLVERLLEIGSLRQQAADILERVYEERDDARELARILEVQVSLMGQAGAQQADAEAHSRYRDTLRRVATLKDTRLHDDAGAFAAFARYLPLDPLDLEVRAELIEIAGRLGNHGELVGVFEQTESVLEDPQAKAQLLMATAQLCESQLQDTARATALYQKVLELREHTPEPAAEAARALDRIYVAAGNDAALIEVLRSEIELELDAEVKSQLQARLAGLLEMRMSQVGLAIEVWQQRLEADPADREALGALDRLYETTGRFAELVPILEQRHEQTSDPGEQRELLVRQATVLADKLDKVDEAIAVWETVLETFGNQAAAREAVEQLYSKAERWEDLSESYLAHAEVVDGEAQRVDLWRRLGDLRLERLGNPEIALDAYREGLALDEKNAALREALNKLLATEDALVRREAAAVLRGLYEAENDNTRLLDVLEVQVQASDDPLDKVEVLKVAARVADRELGDVRRALGFAQAAVREGAGHMDLREWLAELDRLSLAAGERAAQAALLQEIVERIFDGELKYEVTFKVALLARDDLGQLDLSRDFFEQASVLDPARSEPLLALQELYEKRSQWAEVQRVLERRIEVSSDDQERRELLFKKAQLLAEQLQEPGQAIESYEAIILDGLDERAVAALEALYRSEQRYSDLVTLLERKLDDEPARAADHRVAIAQVLADHLGDRQRALDEVEAALEGEPQHVGASAFLAQAMEVSDDPEYRGRAAALLEPIYRARADHDRVMQALNVRLESLDDPAERRSLLLQLAKLYEEQKEDFRSALDTVAKLFHEDIGDESVVTELERLARVADAQPRLAEIYAAELAETTVQDAATAQLARRTGELLVERGDDARALTFLERALEFEPDSVELFELVDRALERLGKHRERVDLYTRTLEQRFEPGERLKLLHTIARLERGQLKDPPAAIEAYVQVLDIEERDAEALQALTELYRETERHEDLAEHLLRRAETAETVDEQAEHRLALARLCRTRLDDAGRAIDQLEEITRILPQHALAIADLEALRDSGEHRERVIDILRPIYESTDSWQRLISLNEDRLSLTEDVIDRMAILKDNAELWEQRGHAPEPARTVLGTALDLDPNDSEVRTNYERLVQQTGAWAELAERYERALEVPDLIERREYLALLVRAYDEHLDDPRSALRAARRLLELERGQMGYVEKVEQLSMLLGDWSAMVEALEVKSDLQLDDSERAGTWAWIAEIRRDMLNDVAGAVEAGERTLDFEPSNLYRLDFVIGLYQQHDQPERLVELCQQRLEATEPDDVEARYDLLLVMADTYQHKLDDLPAAVEQLDRALAVKPGDALALERVAGLHKAQEDWPQYLATLERLADSANEVSEKVRFIEERARVLSSELSDPDAALQAYRTILELDPSNTAACAAALEIGREQESLRGTVAELLVPLLSGADKAAQLVEVLQLRLTVETEPSARVATLQAIARVKEELLSDATGAVKSLLQAASEAPDDESLHAELERLCEATQTFTDYAATLEERAGATFDTQLAQGLWKRLGRVAEEKLGDAPRAIEAFGKALEQGGDNAELLTALDRLYVRVENFTALADVLERRLAFAVVGSEQGQLHARMARLFREQFDEPARALSSLRLAIESDPEQQDAVAELEHLADSRELFEEASETLETVYRRRGQTDRLASLFERRVGFAEDPQQRRELRMALVAVLEKELGDPGAAQRVLYQGLKEDPTDAEPLREIERLLAVTGDHRGAAVAIEEAVGGAAIEVSIARSLYQQAAAWYRDQVGDPAAALSALGKALELDATSDEVLQGMESLQRQQGDEVSLIETLHQRARLQDEPQAREELYRQLVELARGGAPQRVDVFLRELLERDDSNLWALQELQQRCENEGGYKEALDLVQRRIELVASDEERTQLRHHAARLAREKLNQGPAAAKLYAQLFEGQPGDSVAASALRELYAEGEQWEELSAVLQRLIEGAEPGEGRTGLRLELAELCRSKLEDAAGCAAALRAVLQEDPAHAAAVQQLSALYEAEEQYQELAELLAQQIAVAQERSDFAATQASRLKLAQLQETELSDRGAAIQTLEAVLMQDGGQRQALESLVRLLKLEGRTAEAARRLAELVELSDRGHALELIVELAETQRALGDTDAEIAALEKGMCLDETSEAFREQLLVAYEKAQRWEPLANLIASNALRASGSDEKVALLRKAAKVHADKRGDAGAAAAMLAQASEINPNDRELLLELCDAYTRSGRGDESVRVLEQIVESFAGRRSKELVDVHRRLAAAYHAGGKATEAITELDKAFRIEPGNMAVLKELGLLSFEVADYKKAQQMFRALLLQKFEGEGPITKAEVFFHLAEVHERMGEIPKAKQMAERAIQTDSELRKAQELLDRLS